MTCAKLYIYNGVGARDLYIDEAHTALDIFRFAAFLDIHFNAGIKELESNTLKSVFSRGNKVNVELRLCCLYVGAVTTSWAARELNSKCHWVKVG